MQNCFLMPSQSKSHIILVLDRLPRVAWINRLVIVTTSIAVKSLLIVALVAFFMMVDYMQLVSQINVISFEGNNCC